MNVEKCVAERVDWIRKILAESRAKGIVYGNSGGKDCTLVGILCKMATDNVLGVILPCQSSRNYGSDRDDALAVGKQFEIEQTEVDLTLVKERIEEVLAPVFDSKNNGEKSINSALININPRIRMTVLYAIAQSRGYLVAGTGNLCEATMGYFTKWGDGAHDFNPIADLTVPEIYEYLRYLGAPDGVIEKAPSAGLYEGQTDEKEMGISYQTIADYLRGKEVNADDKAKIERAKALSAHKTCIRKFPD